jgi:hypothetical protein
MGKNGQIRPRNLKRITSLVVMKMIMDDDEPLKCALCPSPAARGSILCKSCRQAAQDLTKALEEEQEEARQQLLALDLLRQHYD